MNLPSWECLHLPFQLFFLLIPQILELSEGWSRTRGKEKQISEEDAILSGHFVRVCDVVFGLMLPCTQNLIIL